MRRLADIAQRWHQQAFFQPETQVADRTSETLLTIIFIGENWAINSKWHVNASSGIPQGNQGDQDMRIGFRNAPYSGMKA